MSAFSENDRGDYQYKEISVEVDRMGLPGDRENTARPTETGAAPALQTQRPSQAPAQDQDPEALI